ncbi:uncharacterized protein LOC114525210 isoform X1 [Dendronephthya gigantea]|uniref:uncharacterized protein LOC114525210 isoform X1 n=1 Tax=Dendronephthya gigantea TaxID=151771 RepID=UPI00106962AD|nr:uncharacterized protein LOC114525210 isoform X1 [Dendronephthya gigantea]XP_028402232.1 uncharacterized protein LOC114525210 isoform X1 [Dendronephthya gigantea]XP_028402234.1 uncharacterized protein LOC114525210 isoform X1 [Dendronephthya gigantea]XP_028402235.1 uncharacterized protein LOC114525210 isoform X1 [Dendronephthya gigantea]
MASDELQEKANFTRLSRLLVDKGTEALRNTFDAIHPHVSLPGVLATNKTSLQKLKPRIINNSQWDLLFPPSGNPPDSKTFDITLLTVLFRNICGFPSTGWGVMPPDTDRSTQANITRIKYYRNEVIAHVTTTRVENSLFQFLWKKISKALVELGIPQSDVDDLEKCLLGPEEKIYVQMLEDWKLREDECIKKLRRIECSVNHLTQVAEETRIGLNESRDAVNETREAVNETREAVNETREAVNETRETVIEIRHSLAKRSLSIPGDTNPEKKSRMESDEDLLRKLPKHNFMGKIRRKVNFFLPGTRKWLLRNVDEWFQKCDSDSRIRLITAGPGFGKSVFAAKICDGFGKKGKLAACHFCDFSNSNLRDPMVMMQSLASQMCGNVPGFKKKLLDQLKRPHQVQNLRDAFQIYLQNPLDELEIKEPRLVVIDGLDESAADHKNEITHLIAEYFPDLPEYIKILVTSRPEISVADLRLRNDQKTNIANVNANNNSDLELYFKDCLPSLVGREVNQSEVSRDLYEYPHLHHLRWRKSISLLSIFVAKCQGSFLYAYYFQSGLRGRYNVEKITDNDVLAFLPEGMNSVYQGYFRRLEDELSAIKHEKFDVLKILEMLAASEGYLPLTFIAQAFGLAPDCRETKDIINKINETVSCLLYVSDDRLTVFHKSVIDWLLAKSYKDHQYAVKLNDGHRSLWLLCEKVFKEIKDKGVRSGLEVKFTNDVEYALKHGLKHLEKCEMEEGVFWSVDVIIVCYMLTVNDSDVLLRFWLTILQCSWIKKEDLRACISYHVSEFGPLESALEFVIEHYEYSKQFLSTVVSQSYLQGVLTHSPEGYFSVDEKKIAETLLSNVSPFVESNSYEVLVLPRAVWKHSDFGLITAVALSNDAKRVAVVIENFIHVLSLPTLVEIMNYSTKLKRISCCTFSPDDSLILFGKLETAFNIAGRKEVPFFPGNEETFETCAFSRNGKRLVTSDGSNTIKLWDVAKQKMLSSLCAGFPVRWCSFSVTGLFIIGNSDSLSDPGYSLCVWNAITLQRSDKRKLSQGEREKPDVLKSTKCERCFQRVFEALNSKHLEIRKSWTQYDMFLCPWICKGVVCIFSEEFCYSSDTESIPLTAIVAWNYLLAAPDNRFRAIKIPALEDNLWLYSDFVKLIVFKTLAPKQAQLCLSQATVVYSSSFSPDGSRLASCNSDGYINVWNVYTSQVEQRFKISQCGSRFLCWWSEDFLFVISEFNEIPKLTRYPVDDNLEIVFTHSQDVALENFSEDLSEFRQEGWSDGLYSKPKVGFSEGFVSLALGGFKPAIVLDVRDVDGPVMLNLPGIEPEMEMEISPGGAFISGCNKNECYIWKRNTKKPTSYEVFYHRDALRFRSELAVRFGNDSDVAIVMERSIDENQIIDLNTGDCQNIASRFNPVHSFTRSFCINMREIVLALFDNLIIFFDMYSGAILDTSYHRYLKAFTSSQAIKLSPKETMLAYPDRKGDMVFLRLSIPQNPLLNDIKQLAVARLDYIKQGNFLR